MEIKSFTEINLLLIGIKQQIEQWETVPADDKEIIRDRMQRVLAEIIAQVTLLKKTTPNLNKEAANTIIKAAILLLERAKKLT